MATRCFKFNRVKKRSAFVALVSAGIFVAAFWAGSFYKAVSQIHIAFGAEKLFVCMLCYVAVFVQVFEN